MTSLRGKVGSDRDRLRSQAEPGVGPWSPWLLRSSEAASEAYVAATASNGPNTVKEIAPGPALLNGTTNVQAVVAKVLPAVVAIDAKSTSTGGSGARFSGRPGPTQEDQGSGMIITSTGEVVTDNHVIAGATTITVTLYGQTKALPATLVDTDPTNDVALLQITGQANLPTVSYADSDAAQVGDGVVAIGNALGLSLSTPTVTQGIISAKGRTVTASDSSGSATETLTDMFQTDAAINPGNSGGPLVDSSGKVIAMNTAVAAATGGGTSEAQGIGFAIPSNKIQNLLPGLRNQSIGSPAKPSTGFLGVSLESVSPQLRSAYGFVPTQGAVVTPGGVGFARRHRGNPDRRRHRELGRQTGDQRRPTGGGHPERHAGPACEDRHVSRSEAGHRDGHPDFQPEWLQLTGSSAAGCTRRYLRSATADSARFLGAFGNNCDSVAAAAVGEQVTPPWMRPETGRAGPPVAPRIVYQEPQRAGGRRTRRRLRSGHTDPCAGTRGGRTQLLAAIHSAVPPPGWPTPTIGARSGCRTARMSG